VPRPNTVCCTEVNHGLGRISSLEVQVYEGLLEEMMREIDGLPYRKAPDLMSVSRRASRRCCTASGCGDAMRKP
jgi:hypothetical protein